MVERICPACRFGNSANAQYCNKCGAALEWLVRDQPQQSTALVPTRQAVPTHWKQIGTTVALGAFAVIAERGLAWLRQRNTPSTSITRKPQTASQAEQPNPLAPARKMTTIVSQRLIEITKDNAGNQRVEDRHVWRKIEE